MWKAFGTETDSNDNRPHIGYFRPRISSISGALHSLTKQRFLTPPTSGSKDDDTTTVAGGGRTGSTNGPGAGGGGSSVLGHHGNYGGINPSSFDVYSFDASRINGTCLTGATVAPSPTRSSYGELLAYSRSPSARASIDSTAAHAVYDIDLDGKSNYYSDIHTSFIILREKKKIFLILDHFHQC